MNRELNTHHEVPVYHFYNARFDFLEFNGIKTISPLCRGAAWKLSVTQYCLMYILDIYPYNQMDACKTTRTHEGALPVVSLVEVDVWWPY